MEALPWTGYALHKAELEYNRKFGHTLGRIQNNYLISRIGIFYSACSLATQNVAPTLPGFQGIKLCVQYLDIHRHKPMFYSSNTYYGSNAIRLTWSGNQVEYHTTHNFLECHQDAVHARTLNIIQSVSDIIHTLLGVAVCCKV